MSWIDSFAKSGAWDYRSTIVPAMAAAPLAVEGAILAKNLVQNPGFVKEKLQEAKEWTVQSFSKREGESSSETSSRIAKNALAIITCLGLMGAAIFVSVTMLPSSMMISCAISSVTLIGKLFLNANDYKRQIIEAFTAKPGEDPLAARKRIGWNIAKVVLGAALAVGLIAIGASVLQPIFANGFSWNAIQAIPFQTKGIVFLEYASLGLLHLSLAYSKYKKGEKGAALFHLAAAVLGFVFPALYWNNDMRLHHSFYGLLMMAIPYRPIQMLGSAICFDSSLYFLSPVRGYVSGSKTVLYDFINSIVDNFSLFFNTYLSACALQEVNDAWAKNTKAKKQAAVTPSALESSPANGFATKAKKIFRKTKPKGSIAKNLNLKSSNLIRLKGFSNGNMVWLKTKSNSPVPTFVLKN